jgi:hypothetical protein
MVTALSLRALQFACQMHNSVMQLAALVALLAGPGAVMSGLDFFRELVGVEHLPWQWCERAWDEIVEVGGWWDSGGRSLLFLLGVLFWAEINLALQRIGREGGVRYTGGGMVTDWMVGRSVWGQLVAESEGRAPPGWGVEGDTKD